MLVNPWVVGNSEVMPKVLINAVTVHVGTGTKMSGLAAQSARLNTTTTDPGSNPTVPHIPTRIPRKRAFV
jgi:hypothetical protein